MSDQTTPAQRLHLAEKRLIITFFVASLAGLLIFPNFLPDDGANFLPSYKKTDVTELVRAHEDFIERYKTGKKNGVDIVSPPAGSDIYIKASRYSWAPVLRLKKGTSYRLHTFSVDYLHGFKIHELNARFEATPGYDSIFDFTPAMAGEFEVICDEYCGVGHHNMKGVLIVDP